MADYKRKQYFIKRGFQFNFIIRFVILVIIGAAISGTLMYFFTASELETEFSSAHLTIRNTWDLLKPSVLITHIAAVLLVAVMAAVMVLYLSHRIAGPLYKLELVTREFGKGNLALPVAFREKDELAPLKTAFEEMAHNIGSSIQTISTNIEALENARKKIEAALELSTITDEEKKALAGILGESLEKCRTELKTFKLPEIN